jgi:hypothetical protein
MWDSIVRPNAICVGHCCISNGQGASMTPVEFCFLGAWTVAKKERRCDRKERV